MAKKLIALVLVLCMALPMFVACGEEKKPTTQVQQTVSKSDDPEIAKVNEYLEELAAEQRASIEGKTFTWIGVGVTKETEETGDLEEDALYYRQRDLEDIFGITWVTAENEGVEGGPHPTYENVRKDVMAGTKAYNVVGGTTAAVCQPLFIQDCLADISDYSVIDLEQEWWTASLRDTYQIVGATYFLTGMIVRSYFLDSYCVMYNKEVADNYSVPNLYELVNNNEWTFDKFFEISEYLPTNENGNGAYRFNRPNGTVLMQAYGYPITHFDETGAPYVPSELSKELSDLADYLSSIFGNEAITAGAEYERKETVSEKYGHESFTDMFAAGEILFFINSTGEAAYLREEDVNLGILPMPKKDSNQEKYISYIEPWGAYHVAVPKTTNDAHVTDVILEAMGALSLKYLKPAIYDNILKSRSTYDEESKNMVDLILEGKTYDLVNMLQKDETYVQMLDKAFSLTSESFASKYKMQGRVMNNEIKSKLQKIQNAG